MYFNQCRHVLTDPTLGTSDSLDPSQLLCLKWSITIAVSVQVVVSPRHTGDSYHKLLTDLLATNGQQTEIFPRLLVNTSPLPTNASRKNSSPCANGKSFTSEAPHCQLQPLTFSLLSACLQHIAEALLFPNFIILCLQLSDLDMRAFPSRSDESKLNITFLSYIPFQSPLSLALSYGISIVFFLQVCLLHQTTCWGQN